MRARFVAPVALSAVVALVLLWLRRRRKQKHEQLQDAPSAAASQSPAMAGVRESCQRIEHELNEAKERQDTERCKELRRTLCHLYQAMDMYEGKATGTSLSHGVAALTTSNVARAFGGRSGAHYSSINDDVSSLSSFMSANASLERQDFEYMEEEITVTSEAVTTSVPSPDSQALPSQGQPLYDQALELARRGEIIFRKVRCVETGCTSKDDFLARLHCVRLASGRLLSDESIRTWLIDTGRNMMTQMLRQAGSSTDGFVEAFDDMMVFLEASFQRDNGAAILLELKPRGVVCLSLFDAVLDFVLFDAFDDMKSLPSSVTSVLESNWIPRSAKAKTLSGAIWSVLRTRSAIARDDGLLTRFYAIMKHVSPVLACGLLKCADEKFSAICNDFKDIILQYTEEMFQFDAENTYTEEQLAKEMLTTWRACADTAATLLES